MVWLAVVALTGCVTCGAAEYSVLPAWLAITEQLPVALVMVYVPPTLLHEPALVKVTVFPLAPPVAATVKLLP
jgi:hypothetical protein